VKQTNRNVYAAAVLGVEHNIVMLHCKVSYYFYKLVTRIPIFDRYYLFEETHYFFFFPRKLILWVYHYCCSMGAKSLLIITSDLIVFQHGRLNRFREFNNYCYAYRRRLMCIQNIIVITQIFEIFCCSRLFILVIQLFVVYNAFSDDWLISIRIHWSVTLKSRIIVVALGQSFKLSFFHVYYSRHSVYRQSPLYWIGNRYLSAFHIINIPQLCC